MLWNNAIGAVDPDQRKPLKAEQYPRYDKLLFSVACLCKSKQEAITRQLLQAVARAKEM